MYCHILKFFGESCPLSLKKIFADALSLKRLTLHWSLKIFKLQNVAAYEKLSLSLNMSKLETEASKHLLSFC